MSPSKRRKRTIGTRANVTRLDEELAARAKRWKSEESAVSSEPSEPKQPTLTPAQMGLMGLRPDPCNPERVLQPLNPRPVLSDVVMIDGPPSLLLSTEDDASTPNKVPLTRQALRRDNEANSHPPATFRPEYQLHPYQGAIPVSSTALSLPPSSSSLTQPFSQMTPVHQGDGSMSSQATPPPLPTSQALKVFMTEFERDEELNLTDDVKHVEGDRVLMGYDGSQSHELRGSGVDSTTVPPSVQDVRQFAVETSIRTHQQQTSHNDFVDTLIKKRQDVRASKTKLKYTSYQQLFLV